MRIGVVTASYPRVDGEHAGNFVATQVTALRAAGHTVDVIGAHTIESRLFYGAGAPDELEQGGVRRYLGAAQFTAQLTAAVSRRAPDWDLVLAHWLAPSALAGLGVRAQLAQLTGKRRPVPILAIAHGGDVHLLRRLHLLAPTLHLLHAAGVRLAFVSEELRDIALRAAPRLASWLDEAVVQPMGIDVAHFAAIRAARTARFPVPTTIAARAQVPIILVIARLVPVKGVDVVIRAFQQLRCPARLVIAGDGPERAGLEMLASSASQSIEFLGTVDATTRDQLLQDAACMVIPSRVLANGRTEGTPMIAIEALAAGVPVVASAVGGLHDIGRNRSDARDASTFVPPDDPRALTAAIESVLTTQTTAGGSDKIDASRFDVCHATQRLLTHARGGTCETDDTKRRRSA